MGGWVKKGLITESKEVQTHDCDALRRGKMSVKELISAVSLTLASQNNQLAKRGR